MIVHWVHDSVTQRQGGSGGWRRVGACGVARLQLVSGVALLHPEDAVFEAMLDGWHAQRGGRRLAEKTVTDRIARVRSFTEFAGEYPWRWTRLTWTSGQST